MAKKFEQGPVYTGQYECQDCDHIEPWTDWWWPKMFCTCGSRKKMQITRALLTEAGQKVCQRCTRPFTPSKFTPYQKYCPSCGNRKGKTKKHGGKLGKVQKIKVKSDAN